MHMWRIVKWVKHLNYNSYPYRTGIRVLIDKDVDPEVTRACKEFCQWLRTVFNFPVRVPIHIKSSYYVEMQSGELVSALCFQPFDKTEEPFIKVATGDYYDLLKKWGKDEALAAVLGSIAHELTHYFQWINGLELTKIGRERQATLYADEIIAEYSEIREHP